MKRIVLSVLDASRSDRVSRFTLGCTVALGLVLVLSASGFSDDDNDCDDDDNSCCRCVPAYVACSPCKPAFAAKWLCPKELQGQFGDTYWYDGWKGTLISHCGGLVFDLPHDELVEVGCDGLICKNLIEVQLLGSDRTEHTPQKRYCVAADRYEPVNAQTVITELGMVSVPEANSTGRDFHFRVLRLRTPGERTRWIGMEVETVSTSTPGRWHSVPASERSEYVHQIDARLMGAPRTLTVSTYRAVQW